MPERLLYREVEETRLLSKVFKETQVVIDKTYDISVMPSFIQVTEQEPILEEEVDACGEDKDIDVKKQYAGYIEEINKSKEEIIEKANREADQIRQSAYKEGKTEGYNDGKVQAENENKEKLDEINDIKYEIQKERKHLCNNFEGDIIDLVLKISDKIFNENTEQLKETITDRVYEALKNINGVKNITIRVNNDDAAYLSSLKDKFAGESLNVVPDYKLSTGDFVIETPNGLIDYSAIRVLKNVKDSLIEVLKDDRA